MLTTKKRNKDRNKDQYTKNKTQTNKNKKTEEQKANTKTAKDNGWKTPKKIQQKQNNQQKTKKTTNKSAVIFLEYFFAPKAKSIHGASTKEGGVEVTKPKGQNCQDGRKQMHGKGVWGPMGR